MDWGQTLSSLMHDLREAVSVDFVTNTREIEQLKKYKTFEDIYVQFRAFGGNPDGVGVLVASCVKEDTKEGYMQFFLLERSTADKLGNLLNKKKKEWSSEDQNFMIDDNPSDNKKFKQNLIEVNPDSKVFDTANPNVKLDLSYLDPSFKYGG